MENDNAIEISAEELARLTTEIGLDPPSPTLPLPEKEPATPATANTTNGTVNGMGGSTQFQVPQPAPGPAPQMASASAYAPAQEVSIRPAAFMPLQHSSPQTPNTQHNNMDMLLDIGLRVTVELGRTQMEIRDVLGLAAGSVVELDRQAGEPVDILINDRLVARGEVVVIDDRFGVRVTEIESPAQRVRSLH